MGILFEISSDEEHTLRQNSSFTIFIITKLFLHVQSNPFLLIYYIHSEHIEKTSLLSSYFLCVFGNHFHAPPVPFTGWILCCAVMGWRKSFLSSLFLFNTSIIIWSSPYLSTFTSLFLFVFPYHNLLRFAFTKLIHFRDDGNLHPWKKNKSEFDWTKPQAPCCHEKALLWAATWTRWPPDVPFGLNYSLINMCSLENLGWMFRLAFTKISAISH